MVRLIIASVLSIVMLACQPKQQEVIVVEEVSLGIQSSAIGKERLSDYGFFTGELKNLEPVHSVVHYELNAPLFTDYA